MYSPLILLLHTTHLLSKSSNSFQECWTMAWHTGAFHLIVHYQLILIPQCLPTLQIIPCSIIFLMLLSTFPNRPSLEMLILTGQWIFTTTALSQASPSDLLLLLRPGNVKSNLLSHSPLQKLNILLLVMLVKNHFIFVPFWTCSKLHRSMPPFTTKAITGPPHFTC